MISKNLKTALRILFKQKLYTTITVLGLAIGFTGSLLISVFVWNELSYESMHKNRNDIYRITLQFGKSSESMVLAGAMPALGPAAKTELSEVKDFVRVVSDREAMVKVGDSEFKEKNFIFADESILDVFTFEVISMSNKHPLSDPFDVMLSRSTAEKYFGKTEVLGKILQYHNQLLKVTGVYRDIKGNTQIKPDIIASYKTKEVVFPVKNDWGTFGADLTYLFLNKKMSETELEKILTDILVKHTSKEITGFVRLIPEHFPGIHLNSTAINDLVEHGNKKYVYLFSSIALFVLLIASLNYINLSTARAFNRAKEIGIKKVLGAGKNQLIRQFLSEAFMITFFALIISLVLFEIFYPILLKFLDIKISIEQFGMLSLPVKPLEFYLIVITTYILVGLLSGLYPAFYLTHSSPVKSIRMETERTYKGFSLRKALVVIQFGISILLIFGTTVIFQQINYMRNYDIGLTKDNVILLNYFPNGPDAESKYETLKQKLLLSSGIKNVSGVCTLPGIQSIAKSAIRLKESGENESRIIRFNGVDYSFINTFNIKIISGRNFSKDFALDRDHAVILNESAARQLYNGDILGKQVILAQGENNNVTATVIGIVKDFHIESLQKAIEPLVLYINPKMFYSVAIKTSPDNIKNTLQYIESTWKSIFPEKEFSYTYFAENYNELYTSEDKTFELFTIFSSLAVFIASLGLFGLISFIAARRKKEIGIRKVLGSTVNGIVKLILQDYLKLIVIASLISMPVSYLIMNKWLQDFAYKVNISWWIYLAAGGIALIIALLTVSVLVIKAAIANPVESLKYE